MVDSRLNNFEWTALMTASFVGDDILVEYLLNRGADYTLTTSRGDTAKGLAGLAGY